MSSVYSVTHVTGSYHPPLSPFGKGGFSRKAPSGYTRSGQQTGPATSHRRKAEDFFLDSGGELGYNIKLRCEEKPERRRFLNIHGHQRFFGKEARAQYRKRVVHQ
jgi:hypothetical protein